MSFSPSIHSSLPSPLISTAIELTDDCFKVDERLVRCFGDFGCLRKAAPRSTLSGYPINCFPYSSKCDPDIPLLDLVL
jgi:hypothetical protein